MSNARQLGGDQLRDKENITTLANAIREAGFAAVRKACGDANLPHSSVKNLKASGLLAKINTKKGDENYKRLLAAQDHQAEAGTKKTAQPVPGQLGKIMQNISKQRAA